MKPTFVQIRSVISQLLFKFIKTLDQLEKENSYQISIAQLLK